MNRNGSAVLWIVLGVIGVVLVLGAGIAAKYILMPKQPMQQSSAPAPSPTPPAPVPQVAEGETANWKVYRNEKYGFEFKYPGDLIYQEIKEGMDGYSEKLVKLMTPGHASTSTTIFGATLNLVLSGAEFSISANYSGHSDSGNKTFDQWFQYEAGDGGGASGNDVGPINIGGVKGYYVLYKSYFDEEFLKSLTTMKLEDAAPYVWLAAFYNEKNGAVVYAQIDMPSKNKQLYLPLLNKILSTFKFI